MTFLTPTAALITAAVTLPILVLLYFLKLRRQVQPISSTLLWNKSIHDLQVNTPFQKLRRNLLLFLQLVLLAAILIAIARPVIETQQQPGQRTVIMIDHSASMNAIDIPGKPTRLTQAKTIANRLIESLDLSEGDNTSDMMIVSFAERARVLQPLTSDKSKLRAAIEQIKPTDQLSKLDQAVQLIEPYTRQTTSDASTLVVYLLSDGQLHQQNLSIAGKLDLRFIRIPAPAALSEYDNLAFVSLAGRRDDQYPQRVNIFASLANSSTRQINANISLKIDNQLQKITSLSIPPASTKTIPGQANIQLEVDIPAGGMITLSHDHNDALSADDRVSMVMTSPTQLRILLITRGNPFLEQALRATGDNQVITQTPGWYELTEPSGRSETDNQGFDMVVFDRYSPQNVPTIAGLYFAAAPPIENLDLLKDDAQSTRHVILDWSRDHPVMRHVSLDNLVLGRTGWIKLPPAANSLAIGSTGPTIASLKHENRQHILVAFDSLDSNWPMQTSFPVFISNAVSYLTTTQQGNFAMHFRTGDIVVVPTVFDDGTDLTWEGPTIFSATVRNNAAAISPLDTVGTYHSENAPPPYDRLTVNLLDMIESNLQPANQLQLQIDNQAVVAATTQIQKEIWYWFIAFALMLSMIEWMVYTRRMHL